MREMGRGRGRHADQKNTTPTDDAIIRELIRTRGPQVWTVRWKTDGMSYRCALMLVRLTRGKLTLAKDRVPRGHGLCRSSL